MSSRRQKSYDARSRGAVMPARSRDHSSRYMARSAPAGQLGQRWHGAEPPVPPGVDLDSASQVRPVEVGPQGVQEHELGVGGLPGEKVGQALLAAGADEQVDVG